MIVLGAFLAACNGDTTFNQVAKKMEVTPTLTDLGDVVVGQPTDFELQLVQTQGDDISVDAITVTNVDGDFFEYTGDLPLTVPADGTLPVSFTYLPTEAGYHRAQISIVSDASEGTITVEARGHAVEGEASVRPLLLDFGAVAQGDQSVVPLVVANTGGTPLEVAGGDFSAAGFDFTDTLPVDIDPGDEATLHVRYTAPDASTIGATLDLDLGGFAVVPQVALRANDCEHGTPTAYDVDADGYTSCGGDCDDSDPDVHPGGVEVADGADQDCDGLVDEGTDAYDDDGDGMTENDGDCNDGDAAVNPNATEDLANGVDDDCDGVVDYGTTDADADGYSEVGGDCDDLDPASYPGAPELADGVDNDCDGTVDEGTVDFDDDGDSVTESAGDCDDSDATIYPAAPELADWTDNDCDGTVDEGTVNYDDDGDGFTEVGGDCDDGDSTRNPGEAEVPSNGIDDNCDGTVN